MALANGLYIYLPPKENFVYPAGDRACPRAIGWVKKDSGQLVCSSCEKAESTIGYIEEATRANGVELEIGAWIIKKIRSIKFDYHEHGKIGVMKADLRGPGPRGSKKIRGAIFRTSFLHVTSLFKH